MSWSERKEDVLLCEQQNKGITATDPTYSVREPYTTNSRRKNAPFFIRGEM